MSSHGFFYIFLRGGIVVIVCSVNKIAKMYGGNSIFEDISFEIKENDRVGVVGRNGSGKTTLIHLLAGEETPYSGQIHWKQGVAIGYLTQIQRSEDRRVEYETEA